jgi:hypothetical protein
VGSKAVGVYQLAPLRRADVISFVQETGANPENFLFQIERLGAAPLANRPITLKFLVSSFNAGSGLPDLKTDLYRQGCRVLCEEWQEHRRRSNKLTQVSVGKRFATASLLAAVIIFCRRTAIWIGPQYQPSPENDLRVNDLYGLEERCAEEIVCIGDESVRETLDTGLFRSTGNRRLSFSHETYAEFLAAQYLVERKAPTSAVLGMILHHDGSGKVVPQLRETAGWLASMVPEVCQAILEKDPEALLLADAPSLSESQRRDLVLRTLRSYESGDLANENLVRIVGGPSDGARLKYARLADDLRPYIRGRHSHGVIVRRVAIWIANLTRQTVLQKDLLQVALDEGEPYEVRIIAVATVGKIGDENVKAFLKPLVKDWPCDVEDELKGGALMALWPQHLTAEELFKALTPLKTPDQMGLYQQFLCGDIDADVAPADLPCSLDWAGKHSGREVGASGRFGNLAIRLIIRAIDLAEEPNVCDRESRHQQSPGRVGCAISIQCCFVPGGRC